MITKAAKISTKVQTTFNLQPPPKKHHEFKIPGISLVPECCVKPNRLIFRSQESLLTRSKSQRISSYEDLKKRTLAGKRTRHSQKKKEAAVFWETIFSQALVGENVSSHSSSTNSSPLLLFFPILFSSFSLLFFSHQKRRKNSTAELTKRKAAGALGLWKLYKYRKELVQLWNTLCLGCMWRGFFFMHNICFYTGNPSNRVHTRVCMGFWQ